MSWYLWSSLIALLLLMGVEGASRVDKKLSSDEKRQSRQAVYRGNYKFQVPEYLRPDAYARTIYSNDQRDIDGSFNYEYQTDNGISVKQESTGYGANKVVRGYYSYLGADGKLYTVNYIADRNGYRAYGDHLPTQPNVVYTPSPSFPENSEQYQQFIQRPKPSPTDYYGNQYQQQHHTQTAFIPADKFQSQNIYVTDQAPPNYINITPKPFLIAKPITIRPSYGNYVFNNQPISWTTQRPLVSF